MTITIRLPFVKPPLTPNQRLHWAQKAALTREIREAAYVVALALKPRPRFDQPVTITCVWHVPDRRRRDVGSLTLTLKAAIDGIVDAGILPDDSSQHVVEERYRIQLDKTDPHIELLIEET